MLNLSTYSNEDRNKIILIGVLVVIVLALGVSSFLMWRRLNQPEVVITLPNQEEITSTGAVGEDLGEEQFKPSLRTALMTKVPIRLSTSTITYSYKKNKLEMEYCGDYQVALQDLRNELDRLDLKNVQINEDQIIFNDLGECVVPAEVIVN